VIPIIAGGCSKNRFDTGQSTRLLLPVINEYDAPFHSELLQELDLGVCKAHVEFGKDHVQLRDRIRLADKELSKAQPR
jgi:hypothetical protein